MGCGLGSDKEANAVSPDKKLDYEK